VWQQAWEAIKRPFQSDTATADQTTAAPVGTTAPVESHVAGERAQREADRAAIAHAGAQREADRAKGNI
jgi:hypothetical protein